jgi:hypothetical protein
MKPSEQLTCNRNLGDWEGVLWPTIRAFQVEDTEEMLESGGSEVRISLSSHFPPSDDPVLPR